MCTSKTSGFTLEIPALRDDPRKPGLNSGHHDCPHGGDRKTHREAEPVCRGASPASHAGPLRWLLQISGQRSLCRTADSRDALTGVRPHSAATPRDSDSHLRFPRVTSKKRDRRSDYFFLPVLPREETLLEAQGAYIGSASTHEGAPAEQGPRALGCGRGRLRWDTRSRRGKRLLPRRGQEGWVWES